jgi:hypothetical protein
VGARLLNKNNWRAGLTTSTPDGSGWKPTVASIIETHEPFFNLMVSYAIPHTSLRHEFQPEIDAKIANNQVPVIEGLIKIKSPFGNWNQPIGSQESLELVLPLKVAKALKLFEAPIKDALQIKTSGDECTIVFKGVSGLASLQGRFSFFLRRRFPNFSIPFGGDTEVLFRSSKPGKFNFNN